LYGVVGLHATGVLSASIRDRSELAAEAAEGIVDWADSEPRVDVRYTRTGGLIEISGREFLTLASRRAVPRIFHAQLRTLAEHGDPWNEERIEQLVQELADIGVHLEPNERRWPRTPLEPLADHARRHQFLAVMERALDTLTGSP
jgi:hypothetical protein